MTRPSFTSRSRRFADGGAMPAGPQGSASMPQGGAPGGAGAPAGPPASGGAPPQGGAPDPGQQLQAAVQQYVQSKDPQLAVQIADMLVSMMGAGGGGADPNADPAAGGDTNASAPAGAAAPSPQMNRKGGKMPASFGNKTKGDAKPAFNVPAAGGKPPVGKPVPAAGNRPPMDALQKLRFKQAGKQAGK